MTADCLKNKGRPVVVLLVEDNKGDALLLRKAMQGWRSPCNFVNVKTAEDALSLLRDDVPSETAETPDIIILDLNLPQMKGLDLLDILKGDPALKHIPVIVLSSSRAKQDVMQSYRRYANSYIMKPSSLDMFRKVAQAIEDFFVDLILLPDEKPHHRI